MFYLFLFVNSIVNVPFLTILLYCNENFIVVILDPFYYGFFNPIKYMDLVTKKHIIITNLN